MICKSCEDFKRRYETPLYPLVADDALVIELVRWQSGTGPFGQAGVVVADRLLPLARQALANRRQMAALLAASSVQGQL